MSSWLYWEGGHSRGFWQRGESLLWRYRLSRLRPFQRTKEHKHTYFTIDQSLPFQRHEADKQVSQQRRMAVYEYVILLYEQECSPTEIATQLRMSRKRVREFLKGPPSPPVYKQRSTKLAPYKAYLKHKQRFAEDGRGNSLPLYCEVCSQGYDGCCSVNTSYVT